MKTVLKRLEPVFETCGVDAILVTDPYNLHYLTGFTGEGIAFLSRDSGTIVTDSRYTLACEQSAGARGFEVCEISTEKGYVAFAQELTDRAGATTIGFENGSISYAKYARYREGLPEVTWVKLEEALDELRFVKTDEEIEYMRKAAHIADAAFLRTLPYIKPGVTELEITARLEFEMKMGGADGLAFDTIIASGYHSAMPHAVPDEKRIEEGDFVTMDFGCKYRGYCSDMTRTIVVGKASERQKEIYELVLRAQLAAEEALHAGVVGKDIDRIARDIFREAGMDQYFGHGLGHSVGLFIHEEPRLSVREERTILENMIETVEPGLYIPGFGGVRIEDMVAVTADGIDILCESPKELMELAI